MEVEDFIDFFERLLKPKHRPRIRLGVQIVSTPTNPATIDNSQQVVISASFVNTDGTTGTSPGPLSWSSPDAGQLLVLTPSLDGQRCNVSSVPGKSGNSPVTASFPNWTSGMLTVNVTATVTAGGSIVLSAGIPTPKV